MKALSRSVDAERPSGDDSSTAPYFSVRTDVNGPGIFPKHEHPYFELLLQLSGSRTQHLGIRDVELDEGHLVCMGQGLPHGGTLHGESISLVIGFNLPFLCPELPIYAAKAWSQPAALEAAPCLLPFVAQTHIDFRCSVELTRKLQEMGSDLMARSSSESIGSKAYARAKLMLFLLSVVEAFEEDLVEVGGSPILSEYGSERVDELLNFIRGNLAERISIEDAARHLNISPSCLAVRVRRITGKTFGDLLLEVRLKRAKELLLYRDDRISEIAHATGFEDHAYFSRRFRQLVGMTPGDYRKARASIGANEKAH